MGSRRDQLGGRFEARQAATAARLRRFFANAIANQPDASVLGPEFRDETDLEQEIKELDAKRIGLENDLSRLAVDQDDKAVADHLRREIEQLEGVIARERKQTKKD